MLLGHLPFSKSKQRVDLDTFLKKTSFLVNAVSLESLWWQFSFTSCCKNWQIRFFLAKIDQNCIRWQNVVAPLLSLRRSIFPARNLFHILGNVIIPTLLCSAKLSRSNLSIVFHWHYVRGTNFFTILKIT